MGDAIFVTGALGGSLTHGRHLTFTPRLQISEWLGQIVQVRAMMDISDGLSLDLHRMMEASGTGAEIIASAIPIHSDVPTCESSERRLEAALSDGEDFELLFTVDESDAKLLSEAAHAAKISVYRIGRVRKDSGIDLIDAHGNHSKMPASGWQHEI